MPIPDKNVSKRPRESEEDKDEATTLSLCELACALAPEAAGIRPVSHNETKQALRRQQDSDFRKLIKRSMHQKKDEVLYDALVRTETVSRDASCFLKQAIEELAEITLIERTEGKMMEINAFVIPLFLHTSGGLKESRCFQDQEAFELLSKSLQSEGLESPQATVVLVNHGYHLNEIDSITYSHLHEMLRDAFHAMTDKRIAATPAIDRSMSGWPDSPFAPEDRAIELRFLLGFSLKTVDDPFYAVPEDDTAADAYFAAREGRFQQWTTSILPTIKRCFAIDSPVDDAIDAAADDSHSEIHFLYQDLFHGGKERGIAEYFTLQLISELNRGLQAANKGVEGVRAIIGPIDSAGEAVLKVQLFGPDAILITQTEKPVPAMPDWEMEYADTVNALAMIGVYAVAVAKKFAADGKAIDPRPYDGPAAATSA
ncbi:MAG: hypothetical protein V4695_07110 [Pseudomonadota bacterium]